jgi:WhiB family redox-sensing transcriptional regulator
VGEPAPVEWQARAACHPSRFADPDIFYPPRARTSATAGQSRRRAEIIDEAKRICYGEAGIRPACPVRQQCLEWAKATRQREGIWGGQTPEERGVTELR